MAATKSGTVLQLDITKDRISILNTWENFHAGVAKCAKLQPSTGYVLSCGNDRTINIFDSRSSKVNVLLFVFPKPTSPAENMNVKPL